MSDLDRQNGVLTSKVAASGRRRGGSIALKMLADRSLQFFSTQADALFDQAGDAFFDLAESSEEGSAQNMYFDAIKIVRSERAQVSGRWLNAISSAFDMVGSDPSEQGVEQRSPANPVTAPGSFDQEEILLLDNMAAASSRSCHQSLASLQKRFSRLVGTEIAQRNLPLSPELLCTQFVDALSGCRLDKQVRRLLLELYERLVLGSLPELLEQSDQLLQSLGVMATDAPQQLSEPEASDDPDQGTERECGFVSTGKTSVARQSAPTTEVDGHGARGDILSRSSDSPELPVDSKTNPMSEQVGFQGGLALIDRPGLCELLEKVAEGQGGLDQNDSDSKASAQLAADEVQAPEPVGLMVSGLLSQEASGTFELNESDQSIIDLVDRLYASLVEEMALSSLLVKLLMRTSLPFARAALADPSLLEVNHHPARRLLAEIVQCAEELRGVENFESDRLYRCLATAVERFEQCPLDARELSSVLVDLVRDIESERTISRSAEAALMLDANEKEKINIARRQVEELLELRLLGKQFGYAMVVFVEQVWADVLYSVALSADIESERWSGAVHLLDQLLGLEAQADVDLELVDRVLGAMTDVLAEEGLEVRDVDPWQARIRQYLLQGRLRPENNHPLILEKRDAQEIGDYDLRVLVDVVETGLPGEFDHESRQLAAKVDDSVLAEIDSLKKGCWVRADVPGERMQQYWRLVGPVGASENFLFSDRQGQKMLLASRSSLAVKLKHGELTVLDNAQRFERNLSRLLLEQGPAAGRWNRRGGSGALRG